MMFNKQKQTKTKLTSFNVNARKFENRKWKKKIKN